MIEERVAVLDRVPQRHPDVSKEDAVAAWNNAIACAPAIDEDPRRYIAIGLDDRGRLIELVVIRKELGVWLIVHAQCPPQHDIKSRLGFGRRK